MFVAATQPPALVRAGDVAAPVGAAIAATVRPAATTADSEYLVRLIGLTSGSLFVGASPVPRGLDPAFRRDPPA
jgi:hypothetical protein